MDIKQLLNIKNLKNKDLFDIRSFVIVFSVYSLVSICSADVVYNKDRKIKNLRTKVETLKSEYVFVRTRLMSQSKESYLLKKGFDFGFSHSEKPAKIIYSGNEN